MITPTLDFENLQNFPIPTIKPPFPLSPLPPLPPPCKLLPGMLTQFGRG